MQSVEEMCDAFWEFVLELKKGRKSLAHTREMVSEMVKAMIVWGSPALNFIRKVSLLTHWRSFELICWWHSAGFAR